MNEYPRKKDVDIPPVVQDRIALACSQIQTKGRKRTMKTQNRSGKIVAGIAVAACAAVCIGVAATHGPQNTTDLASSDGASTSPLAEVVPSENPFVIKVNAAELTENVHLPINIDTALSDNWVQNILSDDDHTILTNVNIPVTVEGDNISTVTFTVSNGFFQVLDASADDPYVVSGTSYDITQDPYYNGGALLYGSVGGSYTEDEQALALTESYYTSYTVDYDHQSGDDVWFNWCSSYSGDTETYDLVNHYDDNQEQNEVTALNRIFADKDIEITVQYTDGTSASASIGLVSELTENANADGGYAAELFVEQR